MIKLLIWVGIVYLLYRALRNWFGIGYTPRNGAFPKPPGRIDDMMVKDPYCGVYFPKKDGQHLRFKGEDLYFCSTECREKYRVEHAERDT